MRVLRAFLFVAVLAIACPCVAQLDFELGCPAGSAPLTTGGKTFNTQTGRWRANFCVSTSGNGRLICQADGCSNGGAFPTLATGLLLKNAPAQTAPSPLTSRICQNNPLGWQFDATNNTWADWLYLDTSAPGGGFLPVGTPTICRRLWFNDTGLAQFGKNGIISIYHRYGNNLSAGADDRAILGRTENTVATPGNPNSRLEFMYAELGIFGANQSFGSGPDQGEDGIRMVIDDQHTGTLATNAYAVTGSYQADSVCGGVSCFTGGARGIGVRGTAQNNFVQALGGGDTFEAFQAEINQAGGSTGGIGIDYRAIVPSNRFGTQNFGYYADDFGPNANDWGFYGAGSGQNYFGGNNQVGDFFSANSSLGIHTSVTNLLSITTAQLATPATCGVAVQGTGGATTWTYRLVYKDGNGATTPGGPTCSTASGNATLSVSNWNQIYIGGLAQPLPASIDVFRTVAGTTPNTTGKIATYTFTALDSPSPNGGTLGVRQLAADQALAGDGTTAPTVNQTGTIQSFRYLTHDNCASAGGTCGGAAAGRFSMTAGGTTATVSTTAVTAASEISIGENTTLGSALTVTCNTTIARTYAVTTITPGVSFVVTASAAPSANPACLTYTIRN